jgi:hypothetical protein
VFSILLQSDAERIDRAEAAVDATADRVIDGLEELSLVCMCVIPWHCVLTASCALLSSPLLSCNPL